MSRVRIFPDKAVSFTEVKEENSHGSSYTVNYSVEKWVEGGKFLDDYRDAAQQLRALGMRTEECYTCYVGQFGIKADGTREQHEQADEILFGD